MKFLTNTTSRNTDSLISEMIFIHLFLCLPQTTACAVEVVQLVKEFTSHAEGWVFESQLRQIKVLNTGSDSFTAKRSLDKCECHEYGGI